MTPQEFEALGLRRSSYDVQAKCARSLGGCSTASRSAAACSYRESMASIKEAHQQPGGLYLPQLRVAHEQGAGDTFANGDSSSYAPENSKVGSWRSLRTTAV